MNIYFLKLSINIQIQTIENDQCSRETNVHIQYSIVKKITCTFFCQLGFSGPGWGIDVTRSFEVDIFFHCNEVRSKLPHILSIVNDAHHGIATWEQIPTGRPNTAQQEVHGLGTDLTHPCSANHNYIHSEQRHHFYQEITNTKNLSIHIFRVHMALVQKFRQVGRQRLQEPLKHARTNCKQNNSGIDKLEKITSKADYLRFPVLENGSMHSSRDRIRCEKSFFSGSKKSFQKMEENE